jgi:hypothetical protein
VFHILLSLIFFFYLWVSVVLVLSSFHYYSLLKYFFITVLLPYSYCGFLWIMWGRNQIKFPVLSFVLERNRLFYWCVVSRFLNLLLPNFFC